MKDESKTKKQLINELTELRQQIANVNSTEEQFKQLKESNEKFVKAFMQSSVPMALTTFKEGRFMDVSNAFLKFVGLRQDEVIGRTSREIGYITEDQRAILFNELKEKGCVENLELKVGTKGGEIRDGLFNAVMMTLNNEKYLLKVMADITELRRIKKSLRDREEGFPSMVETPNDWIWETDAQGVYTYASPKVKDILGYEQSEVLGKTSLDLMLPDIAERVAKIMSKYFEGAKPFIRVGNLSLHKDGRVVVLETSGVPIVDENGCLAGYRGIDREITERKQAEETLPESERTYREVFENKVEGIFQTTPEGKYLRANPAFARILGYESPIELISAISDIGSQIYLDPSRHSELISLLSECGTVRDFEAQYICKDKKTIWVVINANVIRDDEGNIHNYQGTITDITEKKCLETRYLPASKMEAVGKLVGGIAHDFNNLLLVIQEYVSLMLLDIGSSHHHYRYLKTIEAQVASGADLTGQLLGFTGGGKYAVKSTNMNDIIQETSSIFWRMKKEISIFYEYGKHLWAVEVDRGQIEQLLINLYANAWQAMPRGGELHIKSENVFLDSRQIFPDPVKDGKYVKISITDTGAGMAESTKERIFDPFFTTKGKGIGSGLATVYGIIKGHEGMIDVQSEPGRGTTFTIYLPASDKEATTSKAIESAALKGAETILLVDDEKTALEVTRELLGSLGYQVYAAQSGNEAISVYLEKGKQIDLVILDIIMPGMSGGETFDHLREINPEIRVLLSSGFSINGDVQRILGRGCNGFIPKPFRRKELALNIRRILG